MYILQLDVSLQKASIHMDYLRIGESKLKITLTQDELCLYGMDLSAVDYASTETRRAFWAILDDAKHATGFDAASSKVCVQIYASKTGGCEMFVTSVPASSDIPQKTDDKTMALTVCGVLPKLYGELVCYFDSITKMLTACKILDNQGYSSDSSAWRIPFPNAERYYLYLAGNQNSQTAGSVNSSGILAEFGKPMPELSLSYLNEYCTPLIPHRAVEQLSDLAV